MATGVATGADYEVPVTPVRNIVRTSNGDVWVSTQHSGNNTGHIYRSTDGGSSWSEAASLTSVTITHGPALYVDGNDILHLTAGSSTGDYYWQYDTSAGSFNVSGEIVYEAKGNNQESDITVTSGGVVYAVIIYEDKVMGTNYDHVSFRERTGSSSWTENATLTGQINHSDASIATHAGSYNCVLSVLDYTNSNILGATWDGSTFSSFTMTSVGGTSSRNCPLTQDSTTSNLKGSYYDDGTGNMTAYSYSVSSGSMSATSTINSGDIGYVSTTKQNGEFHAVWENPDTDIYWNSASDMGSFSASNAQLLETPSVNPREYIWPRYQRLNLNEPTDPVLELAFDTEGNTGTYYTSQSLSSGGLTTQALAEKPGMDSQRLFHVRKSQTAHSGVFDSVDATVRIQKALISTAGILPNRSTASSFNRAPSATIDTANKPSTISELTRTFDTIWGMLSNGNAAMRIQRVFSPTISTLTARSTVGTFQREPASTINTANSSSSVGSFLKTFESVAGVLSSANVSAKSEILQAADELVGAVTSTSNSITKPRSSLISTSSAETKQTTKGQSATLDSKNEFTRTGAFSRLFEEVVDTANIVDVFIPGQQKAAVEVEPDFHVHKRQIQQSGILSTAVTDAAESFVRTLSVMAGTIDDIGMAAARTQAPSSTVGAISSLSQPLSARQSLSSRSGILSERTGVQTLSRTMTSLVNTASEVSTSTGLQAVLESTVATIGDLEYRWEAVRTPETMLGILDGRTALFSRTLASLSGILTDSNTTIDFTRAFASVASTISTLSSPLSFSRSFQGILNSKDDVSTSSLFRDVNEVLTGTIATMEREWAAIRSPAVTASVIDTRTTIFGRLLVELSGVLGRMTRAATLHRELGQIVGTTIDRAMLRLRSATLGALIGTSATFNRDFTAERLFQSTFNTSNEIETKSLLRAINETLIGSITKIGREWQASRTTSEITGVLDSRTTKFSRLLTSLSSTLSNFSSAGTLHRTLSSVVGAAESIVPHRLRTALQTVLIGTTDTFNREIFLARSFSEIAGIKSTIQKSASKIQLLSNLVGVGSIAERLASKIQPEIVATSPNYSRVLDLARTFEAKFGPSGRIQTVTGELLEMFEHVGMAAALDRDATLARTYDTLLGTNALPRRHLRIRQDTVVGVLSGISLLGTLARTADALVGTIDFRRLKFGLNPQSTIGTRGTFDRVTDLARTFSEIAGVLSDIKGLKENLAEIKEMIGVKSTYQREATLVRDFTASIAVTASALRHLFHRDISTIGTIEAVGTKSNLLRSFKEISGTIDSAVSNIAIAKVEKVGTTGRLSFVQDLARTFTQVSAISSDIFASRLAEKLARLSENVGLRHDINFVQDLYRTFAPIVGVASDAVGAKRSEVLADAVMGIQTALTPPISFTRSPISVVGTTDTFERVAELHRTFSSIIDTSNEASAGLSQAVQAALDELIGSTEALVFHTSKLTDEKVSLTATLSKRSAIARVEQFGGIASVAKFVSLAPLTAVHGLLDSKSFGAQKQSTEKLVGVEEVSTAASLRRGFTETVGVIDFVKRQLPLSRLSEVGKNGVVLTSSVLNNATTNTTGMTDSVVATAGRVKSVLASSGKRLSSLVSSGKND